MTDNTLNIASFMSYNKDDFYFIQIIKRRKDNPIMVRDAVILKNYYVDSMDGFFDTMVRVRSTCDFENARAYIRLNKRNYKHLGMKVLNRALVYVSSNNNKPLSNVFDAVAGEFHNDPDKKWLIDVDNLVDFDPKMEIHPNEYGGIVGLDGINNIGYLRTNLIRLQEETGREPMTELIPSKSGIHIITRPFNLKTFKGLFPEVSVHKDATCILYCP